MSEKVVFTATITSTEVKDKTVRRIWVHADDDHPDVRRRCFITEKKFPGLFDATRMLHKGDRMEFHAVKFVDGRWVNYMVTSALVLEAEHYAYGWLTPTGFNAATPLSPSAPESEYAPIPWAS